MLQFTGSKRVRHDLAAEQQKQQMDMLTTEVSRKCLDEDINRGCISAQMVFKTFGTQWLQVGDSGPRHLFSSFSFPKSQPPYSQLPIISVMSSAEFAFLTPGCYLPLHPKCIYLLFMNPMSSEGSFLDMTGQQI